MRKVTWRGITALIVYAMAAVAGGFLVAATIIAVVGVRQAQAATPALFGIHSAELQTCKFVMWQSGEFTITGRCRLAPPARRAAQ